MKKTLLKYLLYIVLAVNVLSFTSCGDDDYAPISLSLPSGSNTNLMIDNILQLNPFSTGETYHIQGGDGAYIIEIADTAIADFRYDGNRLTIFPKGIGETSLTISDRSWNTYTLQVIVAYTEVTYEIADVEGVVYGGDLTQNQVNAIRADIEANSPVKAGGKYVFTYTERNEKAGIVSICPSASDNRILHGIFTETANGDQHRIHIELTDGTEYDYTLTVPSALTGPMSRLDPIPVRILLQDVTENYRPLYPALEEAYCVQYIPGGTI